MPATAAIIFETPFEARWAAAAGLLGANELVNAKPDGYTLAQLPHGVFRVPHMQKTAFDTLKDFTWIACLTGYTFGLVVPADGGKHRRIGVVAFGRAWIEFQGAPPRDHRLGKPAQQRGLQTLRRLVVEHAVPPAAGDVLGQFFGHADAHDVAGAVRG